MNGNGLRGSLPNSRSVRINTASGTRLPLALAPGPSPVHTPLLRAAYLLLVSGCRWGNCGRCWLQLVGVTGHRPTASLYIPPAAHGCRTPAVTSSAGGRSECPAIPQESERPFVHIWSRGPPRATLGQWGSRAGRGPNMERKAARGCGGAHEPVYGAAAAANRHRDHHYYSCCHHTHTHIQNFSVKGLKRNLPFSRHAVVACFPFFVTLRRNVKYVCIHITGFKLKG